MTPAVSLTGLIWSLCVGMASGLCFDIVRPIRPRFLGDILFLLFFGWLWLELTFGICAGDLRMGCLVAIGVGTFLWEMGPGRLTRPIFRRFWKILVLPFKKFFQKTKKILKNPFARRKKSSTIE